MGKQPQVLLGLSLVLYFCSTGAFRLHAPPQIIHQHHRGSYKSSHLKATGDVADVYSNPIVGLIGKFLPSKDSSENSNDSSNSVSDANNNKSSNKSRSSSRKKREDYKHPEDIDWGVGKRKKSSLPALSKDLEKALKAREWFVTGNADPSFFSDDFKFEDPDVKVSGIQPYSIGVHKLFDQKVTRGEVVDVVIRTDIPNLITFTWRLEGAVDLFGINLKIKPYMIETDIGVCPNTGLILTQKDRFALPGWDIVGSALFPSLIPYLFAKPAPPISELLKKNEKMKR